MQYRFAHFEVDSDRYELRVNGAPQPVEKLVLDLIVFFARNPNRIVGRDELVEQLWQGRTVSDTTISSCIKSARRALGDSGDSQNYIRTIRGRGFEFTAGVTSAIDTPPTQTDLPAVPERPAVHARPAGAELKPIIAVLPFANQSAEIDEYFADGLTEDIITNLARFRDLRVIADLQRVGMPHFYWTHLLMAAAQGQLGHPDAPASLARITEVKPNFSARAELKKWNAAPDDLEHIMAGLKRAGLRE